jgi:hypothetical protein
VNSDRTQGTSRVPRILALALTYPLPFDRLELVLCQVLCVFKFFLENSFTSEAFTVKYV